MKILGWVVDDEGIRMDPDKVDSVVKWKTLTNRDLLHMFIRSARYLTDDIYKVRIPMGVLSVITGDNIPFKWEVTEQRTFERIKQYVQACQNHRRVPLVYGRDEPKVWLMTNACINGIATVVAQGKDWQTAAVAAFFSAKMNPAQQNYPVHEQEMLAGVEGMLRYRDILQGVRFTWLTDHKGLIHLYNQKNLSGRQARWIEKISEFDFDIKYLPGVENVLPDALSRLYSNDAPGTVRAPSEYVQHAEVGLDSSMTELVSMPLLVGVEAGSLSDTPRRSEHVAAKGPATGIATSVGRDKRKDKPSRPTPVAEPTHMPSQAVIANGQGVGPSGPRLEGQPSDRTLAQVSGTIIPEKVTRRRGPKVVSPAETGRPETSAEFARRVKSRFVLRGPRERTEGGRLPKGRLLSLILKRAITHLYSRLRPKPMMSETHKVGKQW